MSLIHALRRLPALPLAASLALLAPLCGHAQTTTASGWTLSGTAGLVSDYLFRGVSQTQGKPAAQLTFDATHRDGWFAGLFGSGVSNAAYPNGGGNEIDLYGGWRTELSPGVGLELGFISYWFPGAFTRDADGKHVSYDTQELHAAISHGAASAGIWHAVSSHWSGFAVDPYSGANKSSRGSTYIEANWNLEIAPGWTLNLHAGRQIVKNFAPYNFTDVKVGVSRVEGPWTFALAGSHNTGDARKGDTALWTFFDANGRGRNVVGTRWVASVTRSF